MNRKMKIIIENMIFFLENVNTLYLYHI